MSGIVVDHQICIQQPSTQIIKNVFNNHRICIHSTSLSSVFSSELRMLRAFVHPKKCNNHQLIYTNVFNENIKHSTIHSHSICSKDMENQLQNIYDHRHRVSAVCVFFGRAMLTLTPSAHEIGENEAKYFFPPLALC